MTFGDLAWGTVSGRVAELAGFEPPPGLGPSVWVMVPTDAAYVVGRAMALKLGRPKGAVVRKGGGGAVLVAPEALTWVSLYLRPSDAPGGPNEAFTQAGHLLAMIGSLKGVRLEVYDGPYTNPPWPLGALCFASRCQGELVIGGQKVVGLSQHRSARRIRVDVGIATAWEPAVQARMMKDLGLGQVDEEVIEGLVKPVPLTWHSVLEALGELWPTRFLSTTD